jgi:AcrR family transcriptional regulator
MNRGPRTRGQRRGPDQTYGGVPAGERRAQRRRKLFEAGLELIGARGVAKLTVDELCGQAGLTKRYFYEQFSSLDVFTDALYEDAMAFLSEQTMAVAETTAGIDVVREQVRRAAQIMSGDPRLSRLILAETFGVGGGLVRHRDLVWQRATEVLLADAAALARGGLTLDPVRLSMFAVAMSGALSLTLARWVEGGIDSDLDGVTEFLLAFVSGASTAIGS